jgi:hypothetical protein
MNRFIGLDFRKKGIRIPDFTNRIYHSLDVGNSNRKDSKGRKVPVFLLDEPTSLSFDRKTLRPVITMIGPDCKKKVTDIIMATFDISSYTIVNIYQPRGVYVYQYDYDPETSCFSVMLSLQQSSTSKYPPKFSILWKNKLTGEHELSDIIIEPLSSVKYRVTRRTITLNKKNDKHSAAMYNPFQEDGTFVMRTYTPNRPCFNIICTKVSWKDKLEAMLEDKYKISPNQEYPNCFIHYPAGSKELKKLTDQLCFRDRVSAVSYFVYDLSSTMFEGFDCKRFLKDRFATNFDFVSIISRDGKMLVVKK